MSLPQSTTSYRLTPLTPQHPSQSAATATSLITRQVTPESDVNQGIEDIQTVSRTRSSMIQLALHNFVLQTLRRTQLSASNAYAQSRLDARNPSSASQPRKPRSSRNAVSSEVEDPNAKAELEEVATKLFAICAPWSELWAIHGSSIVAAENQQVTTIDDLGAEILSHVPHHLVRTFLSGGGQAIVSLS
jgi:hypothetical protein